MPANPAGARSLSVWVLSSRIPKQSPCSIQVGDRAWQMLSTHWFSVVVVVMMISGGFCWSGSSLIPETMSWVDRDKGGKHQHLNQRLLISCPLWNFLYIKLTHNRFLLQEREENPFSNILFDVWSCFCVPFPRAFLFVECLPYSSPFLCYNWGLCFYQVVSASCNTQFALNLTADHDQLLSSVVVSCRKTKLFAVFTYLSIFKFLLPQAIGLDQASLIPD